MPLHVTDTAAAGRSQVDIRIGECQVHQVKLDVSALTGVDDANGTLPVGLPVLATGVPVTGTTDVIFGLIGPEPVHLEADDHFGNVFISGNFNKNAIEDNLGRALDSNELASLALAKNRLNVI